MGPHMLAYTKTTPVLNIFSVLVGGLLLGSPSRGLSTVSGLAGLGLLKGVLLSVGSFVLISVLTSVGFYISYEIYSVLRAGGYPRWFCLLGHQVGLMAPPTCGWCFLVWVLSSGGGGG